jgi:peptidoglycan hydrolase-like protein with peptidoglycan-binding domain
LRPLFRTIGLLAAVAAQLSFAADLSATKQPAVKQTPKQAPAKPAVKPAVATKSSVTRTTAIPPKPATAKSTAGLKLATKKAPVWPRYYGQQQPTPDRYKEIQQALADKGYFSGSPDGVWSATSTDALKRFQHDQNLNEDGKVDSLSLIALGLGPKRAPTNVELPATK